MPHTYTLRQALVLVNKAQAAAADVRALADHVRERVEARFGVILFAEPDWLPPSFGI